MRQAPGPLSGRAWEGHETQAQPSLHLCAAPESLNLSGVGLGSARNPGRLRQFPCRATWSLSSVDLGSARNPGPHQTVPCRATWSLSSVDQGSACNPSPHQTVPLQSNLEPEKRRPGKHTRRERGQTGVARTLRALPTPASGVCRQCFSLPAAQLNE